MPNVLDHLLLIALALCAYGAFVLFACATERHWNELSGLEGELPDRSRLRLRAAAWALVALGAVAALPGNGAGFGVLLWALAMMAGAIAVAFTLTWRRGWLQPVARGMLAALRI
ncbi:DUF3325 domain-containing protein [Cupriavidus oxalaticus]|uniref:DUF3325 domain-containing protein n=1 Tax=Cupriavidus oxalaticus TaxID=96344 RepID=A0A5P3VD50_9BURK|nr:DUF3325 domain-containing protein [Cupriavidus oxalaticus]QEZ43323.1 DUF3325 domain-containing protein [Cupriavidus oxalaticus]